jgi:dipeptidyl aminopeptidase/acylaminoacyl peptidase
VRIISASGERATERTIPLEDEVWQISAGRRLVYSRRRDDTNIWRVKIPAHDESPGSAELFNSSTLADGKARYSPDGRKISFVSSRSGSEEVWISKADGSDSIRMTFFGGPLIGPPAWSPDGQWLVFHARPAGQSALCIMPAAGGTPRRLTRHPSDETLPTYSRDGRWIYFASVRSGRPQVWKMPVARGDAIPVTTGGGWKPIESPDGKTLFYVSDAGNAIRQVPTTGGIEAQVVAPVCAEYGFALTREALLYPTPTSSGESCEFRLLTLATGRSRPVLRTAAWPIGLVVSVSPDETYFLYEQAESPGVDLMLVKNLRLRPLR